MIRDINALQWMKDDHFHFLLGRSIPVSYHRDHASKFHSCTESSRHVRRVFGLVGQWIRNRQGWWHLAHDHMSVAQWTEDYAKINREKISPKNTSTVFVVFGTIFHKAESIDVTNEGFALRTQKIESTHSLLSKECTVANRYAINASYFEGQTNLHRNQFLIGSEDHRIANFLAEFIAFHFTIQSRRFSRFSMCVLCSHRVHLDMRTSSRTYSNTSTYLHICTIGWHEFFVDVWTIGTDTVLRSVDTTSTADLYRETRKIRVRTDGYE